jgi:hypothetical protein
MVARGGLVEVILEAFSKESEVHFYGPPPVEHF